MLQKSPAAIGRAAFFVDAVRRTVTDHSTDDLSLLAYALTLPPYATLLEVLAPPVDPLRLHTARNHVRTALAEALGAEFRTRYDELAPQPGEPFIVDGPNASRRRLRHVCLSYLVTARNAETTDLCWQLFDGAGGMTDKAAGLAHLCDLPEGTPERQNALDRFHTEARGDANVIDKWFQMQARADVEDLLSRVRTLVTHPDFNMKNPNRLRSIAGPYLRSPRFHDAAGAGYRFAADLIVQVDAFNPQIAARLAGVAFQPWRRLDGTRQALIQEQLDRLRAETLSKDTLEIITKTRNA